MEGISDLVVTTSQQDANTLVGYWVNGTIVSIYSNLYSEPKGTPHSLRLAAPNLEPPGISDFPRLAAPASTNGTSSLILYRQVNETALEELTLDAGSGLWESTTIDVWKLQNGSVTIS